MRVLLDRPVLAGSILALSALLFCAGAEAAPERRPHHERLPQATAISVGEQTLTPWGWADFCNRNPAECTTGALPAEDIELTAQSWSALGRVNILVNAMIQPLSDMDHWNMLDRWDIPTDGYGDCEDYALLKRKLLLAEGFPRQALLITVVKDENGEGHAILTIKTDRGDFILDNMRDEVKAWSQLPYRFVKRQSQTDPDVWEQIGEPTSAPLIVSR
jgi:predicted transglutaminase-like cysteine proteinase